MAEMIECGYRHCSLGPNGSKKSFEDRGNKKFCCDNHRTAEYDLVHPRLALFKEQEPSGEQLRDLGLDKAESNSKHFVDTMRTIAKKIAREKGSVSTDDLRIEAVKIDIAPFHHNAWGSIFRGPEWVVVDRKKSEFKGNHAREIKVWSLR
jgi:hypothetical protein